MAPVLPKNCDFWYALFFFNHIPAVIYAAFRASAMRHFGFSALGAGG
jgi:hypothetical protein